ncbi:MAG TPA: tRNA lysidine(34) synthetase TilS, partial [Planctomycetia bacterium]|nr:tRNA lysidine(34) synthetase TilS [Planctomycetia bacterium]
PMDASRRLSVAHFDHQLRPDSQVAAERVRRLAEELGLPFTAGKPDAPIAGPSLEAQARKARYRFLRATAAAAGVRFVATAHTRDDQVETSLLALFRGAGLRGLAGIPESRPLGGGVAVIRPLLSVTRQELRDYLAQVGQDWSEDSTNDDSRFRRNRLRNEILPRLREAFNPRLDEAILRAAERAREAAPLLDAAADATLAAALEKEVPGEAWLRLDVLRSASPAARRETLRRAFCRFGWPQGRMGAREYDRLAAMVEEGGERAIDLPQGVRARRGAKRLRLARRAESEPDR